LSNSLQSAIVPSIPAGPMAGVPGGWASPNLPTLPGATPPAPPDNLAPTPSPATTATATGGPCGSAPPNLSTPPVATPPAPPDTPAATPPPSTTATTSGGP
jgi:hypothetical protein